jgi:DNA anti-recombination protein RmuC
MKDEEGSNLRPDVIINMPMKSMVIDSKVSLTAYEVYSLRR